MFIDCISRRPSIREANRIETVQPKNVNVKKLRMMNKHIAQEFINGKYHGGRLYLGAGFGSWLKRKVKKVKKFAKKAFEKVIKPAYEKVLKPGLNFLTKNEVGKKVLQGVSSVVGSAVSAIPGVGPIAGPIVANNLPNVLNTVNDVTTAAENVVKSIKEKNPQVTVQQAKDIYDTVKKTYNSLSDEAKKLKAEQMKKIQEKLPDTVKAEGFEAVMKAAPFLPIVDLGTLREEQSPGRGGKIKTTYKIRKPAGADKYGKYSAPIVARVCGRMFLGGFFKSGTFEQASNTSGMIAEAPTLKQVETGFYPNTTPAGTRKKRPVSSVDSEQPKPHPKIGTKPTTQKSLTLLEQLRKKYI